ncbi:MAG: hypothetical protein JXX14_06850, partial [Deltaproteobacteria bacterium]|nr:hypothetical protein [Deltaproteobacteria bacterium]
TDTQVIADSDSGEACQLIGGRLRITEIDVGETVVASADEVELLPIAISPLSGGGSRLAWMGENGAVRVTTLNDSDQIVQNHIAIDAHDFQDIYATADGGVLLLTRNASGGGTLNCGAEANLCYAPDVPIPCFDMYMVGFDDTGERWTARLTGTEDDIPPYSTAPDGPSTTLIWWYAHHGRIASDGLTFAAYFGSAISVSNGTCIDIHQGDRMRVVDRSGVIQDRGFGWGCSPSGYERIIWNSAAHAYVSVCKSQNATSGIAAFAPDGAVIWNVDPWYANFGELALAPNGGYWLTFSDRKPGQPEQTDGLAEVHLVQFTSEEVTIHETVLSAANINARAPHVAQFGQDTLLLLYEVSEAPGELDSTTDRQTFVELRDIDEGAPIGGPVIVPDFTGNRYHALRSFDNGSVAMAVKGGGDTTIQILRVLPCDE